MLSLSASQRRPNATEKHLSGLSKAAETMAMALMATQAVHWNCQFELALHLVTNEVYQALQEDQDGLMEAIRNEGCVIHMDRIAKEISDNQNVSGTGSQEVQSVRVAMAKALHDAQLAVTRASKLDSISTATRNRFEDLADKLSNYLYRLPYAASVSAEVELSDEV